MLPTSTATTTTAPNPIHNDPTTCEYLMECVISIINCVREFFASLCGRETPAAASVVQPTPPPADQKLLPANMHFDRMKAENPQLAEWLNSSDHLKLEINYRTSRGIVKGEYSDVDELQCRCYCDMIFENALKCQSSSPDFKYIMQITITRPAQNNQEKEKSLKFNWNNSTTSHPSHTYRISLSSKKLDLQTRFSHVMTSFPQLQDWLSNGRVNVKATQWFGHGQPNFVKPLVTEKFGLDMSRCEEECDLSIVLIKRFMPTAPSYFLQLTFTKSDSPNDSVTCTLQNMYPQL